DPDRWIQYGSAVQQESVDLLSQTGMRRFLACGFLFATFAGAQSASNTLTAKEAQDGWILLFDGKTLKGWQGRATSVPNTTGDWSVENGSIVCGGKVPSWLSSDATYSDYGLKLQFRGG